MHLQAPTEPAHVLDVLKTLALIVGVTWTSVHFVLDLSGRVNRAYEHFRKQQEWLFPETAYVRTKLSRLKRLLRWWGMCQSLYFDPACECCKNYAGVERRHKSFRPRLGGRRFYDRPVPIEKVLEGTACS